MKRVLVIGSPGAGKSVFSRKLRDVTGLPLHHLDLLYHRSDRTIISREEFDTRLARMLAEDEWIMDGNYQRTLEMRMKACDTVILLDYPTEVCLAGIKSRLGEKREDFPWVAEELDEDLVEKARSFAEEKLPKTYELFERYWGEKEIVILRTREEAERYLVGLRELS